MVSIATVSCVLRDEAGDMTHVGGTNSNGTNWKLSVKQTIEEIESRKWRFYVGSGTSKVEITVVKRSDGSKYLRTRADEASANNLDKLKSC